MKKLLALLFILSIIPFACPEGGYAILDGAIAPSGVPGFGGGDDLGTHSVIVETAAAGGTNVLDVQYLQLNVEGDFTIEAGDSDRWPTSKFCEVTLILVDPAPVGTITWDPALSFNTDDLAALSLDGTNIIELWRRPATTEWRLLKIQ